MFCYILYSCSIEFLFPTHFRFSDWYLPFFPFNRPKERSLSSFPLPLFLSLGLLFKLKTFSQAKSCNFSLKPFFSYLLPFPRIYASSIPSPFLVTTCHLQLTTRSKTRPTYSTKLYIGPVGLVFNRKDQGTGRHYTYIPMQKWWGEEKM